MRNESYNMNDSDMGGGLLVPSSFRRIDPELRAEIESVEGEEKVALILKRCFDITMNLKELPFSVDFPIAEIEIDLYVLELESAKLFKAAAPNVRPLIIAAVLASTYVDLDAEAELKLFLPFIDIDLIKGAVIAKEMGVPFKIFVGVPEAKLDEYLTATKEAQIENIEYRPINYDDAKMTIMAFSECDDYVFDPISVTAAVVFEEVEEETEEDASIIVSMASPMEYAREVLTALGVKLKDENDAKKKLEELFAIDDIE